MSCAENASAGSEPLRARLEEPLALGRNEAAIERRQRSRGVPKAIAVVMRPHDGSSSACRRVEGDGKSGRCSRCRSPGREYVTLAGHALFEELYVRRRIDDRSFEVYFDLH
jgi:hypothetical protein